MSNLVGYTYDDPAAAPAAGASRTSMDELAELRASVLLGPEDERALRQAGEVLADQVEEVLDVWYGFVAANPHLLEAFAGPDGEPVARYLQQVRGRFGQWILDTCNRSYDDAWLAYADEIGRRHDRSGKNQADEVVAADNIPLRTRRSVLTSTETSMPWLAGYYRIEKPRVEASLRAAYAIDASALDSELAPYGVDIFVTGPPVWRETSYHEPYDRELVQGLLKRGRASGFALRDPPADRVLFRSGEYYVLRVGAFAPPTEGSAR